MSGDAVPQSEIIDLTNSDDYIAYDSSETPPLNPSSSARSGDDDTSFQIVDVRKAQNRRIRKQRSNSGVEEVSVEPSQDVAIVEERVLTAQERLDLIREKHARGQSVAIPPPSSPIFQSPETLYTTTSSRTTPREWSSLLNLRVLSSLRNGDLSFRNRRLFPNTVFNNNFPPEFLDFDSLDGDFVTPFGSNYADYVLTTERNAANHTLPRRNAEPIEEANMRRALERSVTDTHKKHTLQNIDLPKPPITTKNGFARSANQLKPNEMLVCIECGHELGKLNPKLPKSASERSSQMFVRGCGHVYCGECTYALQASRTRKRSCPAKDGKEVPASKRGKFRQIYL